MKTLKTKINYYSFDVSDERQNKEYKELCESLKNKGLKKFATIEINGSEELRAVEYFFIEEIELDCTYLFSNQWNTIPVKENKGLSVFDWMEPIFENKRIKKGYWLEQTEEMTTIRLETFRCGYCGKQYHKPNKVFCEDCIGSQYLKRNDLKLLVLKQVLNETPIQHIEVVPEWIITKYEEIQMWERTKRLNQKVADFEKEIQRKKQSLEKEY